MLCPDILRVAYYHPQRRHHVTVLGGFCGPRYGNAHPVPTVWGELLGEWT